eukprot:m51a1_g14076 hypothetical protein (701) ;mRNA; r:1294475-1297438
MQSSPVVMNDTILGARRTWRRELLPMYGRRLMTNIRVVMGLKPRVNPVAPDAGAAVEAGSGGSGAGTPAGMMSPLMGVASAPEWRRAVKQFDGNLRRVDDFYTERVLKAGASIYAACAALFTTGFLRAVPREVEMWGVSSASSASLLKKSVKAVLSSRVATGKEQSTADVRKTLVRVFDELSRLETFCDLNYEGFLELIAKVQQRDGCRDLADHLAKRLYATLFPDHTQLADLLKIVPAVFAEAFTSGNVYQAMCTLSEKPAESTDWRIFRLGLFVGVTSILLLISVFWWFETPSSSFVQGNEVFFVFRALGMAILLVWMWGIDFYICVRAKLNYNFIFGINPLKYYTNHVRVLEIAACFTLVWLLTFVLYMFGCSPPKWLEVITRVWPPMWPLVFACICVVLFLVYQISVGFALVRQLLRVLLAPFFRVKLRDSFLADQLVSLPIVFQDIVFSVCYYSSDVWKEGCNCSAGMIISSLAAILPNFFRFLMCIRQFFDTNNKMQLLNGAKYFSCIVVTVLAVFRPDDRTGLFTWLWLSSAVVASLSLYVWDVVLDWGLLSNKPTVAKPYLREVLLLRPAWIYYLAIFLDLVLRLSWTLTISPGTTFLISKLSHNALLTVIAALEIFRRGMWNVIRIEWEHVCVFQAGTPLPTPCHSVVCTPMGSPSCLSPKYTTAALDIPPRIDLYSPRLYASSHKNKSVQ